MPASIDVEAAAPNATNTTNAFLNTLSLAAPRNCVQKNGAKRRWRRRSNWLWWDIGGEAYRVGGTSSRTPGGPRRTPGDSTLADADDNTFRNGYRFAILTVARPEPPWTTPANSSTH